MKRIPIANRLLLLAPSGAIIAIFIVMMVSMFHFSFTPGNTAAMEHGFTLKHYWRFLGSSFNLSYLTYSLWIAFYCTLITSVLGYVIAYFMHRSGPMVRIVIGSILIIQFFTAYVIRTYAVMLVLGRRGLLNDALMSLGIIEQPIKFLFTEVGVAIGLVLVSIPFMVFPIFASLQAIPDSIERGAASLGAKPLQIFWTVIFPLSFPGLAAGIVIVYLFELTSYIVPGLLGGGYVDMIANFIYNKAMQSFEYAYASAAAVVTLLVSGVVVYLLNNLFARMTRYESTR